MLDWKIQNSKYKINCQHLYETILFSACYNECWCLQSLQNASYQFSYFIRVFSWQSATDLLVCFETIHVTLYVYNKQCYKLLHQSSIMELAVLGRWSSSAAISPRTPHPKSLFTVGKAVKTWESKYFSSREGINIFTNQRIHQLCIAFNILGGAGTWSIWHQDMLSLSP